MFYRFFVAAAAAQDEGKVVEGRGQITIQFDGALIGSDGLAFVPHTAQQLGPAKVQGCRPRMNGKGGIILGQRRLQIAGITKRVSQIGTGQRVFRCQFHGFLQMGDARFGTVKPGQRHTQIHPGASMFGHQAHGFAQMGGCLVKLVFLKEGETQVEMRIPVSGLDIQRRSKRLNSLVGLAGGQQGNPQIDVKFGDVPFSFDRL